MMCTAVNIPSVMIPRFNRPVGERNYSRRLLLADLSTVPEDVFDGAVSAPVATWNLHIIQPRYFAPTYSEVVNLTGLLITKD
jgi:hypothetical protein